jgi:hypothetical protein
MNLGLPVKVTVLLPISRRQSRVANLASPISRRQSRVANLPGDSGSTGFIFGEVKPLLRALFSNPCRTRWKSPGRE